MDSEDAHEGRGLFGAQSPNPAMSIIGAEDEDFENDIDPTVDDRCIHFTSIELLKTRPTHLLVFIQHVILQFDCAPVLCFLHADLFRNMNAKETKKHFAEFYQNFLDKGAVLRVQVPANVAYELERTRPDMLSEDVQKRFAQEVQNLQIQEVFRQLDDFRQKRMMGMTPNESELAEVENHYPTDRVPMEMKEKAMAEGLLDKMSEMSPSIVADEEKCSAIFAAVAFYMKHLGVKTRAADTKKPRNFFKKRLLKKPEEQPQKPKQRFNNLLTEAGRWIGGNNVENKSSKSDTEGDSKNNEKKSSSGSAPSRGFSSEGSSSSISRKTASTGSASIAGSDVSEGSGINISVTSSPDSPHSEIGLTSSRSDPQFVPEGGDVSPAVPSVGLCMWEPPSASEAPIDDNQDKERRKIRNVRRSESLCVERRQSRRSGSTRNKHQSRSRSDVDLQAAASANPPPSPSPHPLSVEGGFIPAEGSAVGPASGPSPQQEEVEPRLLELDQDPPNWREQAAAEALANLKKSETKRQEVINELFATEHAHVRMLSVLQTVFSRPLEREEIMTGTELATIFPNLDEIFDMHFAFYENLKKLRQEDDFIVKNISTTLLNRFSGSEGDWFQKLTARFCSHQSWALEQIKSRQKRDQRFNAFILEAESKPQCRRLQLKDIIPIEMQRLTKYPLLLENIAKSTEDNTEKENILHAAECCRKILNHVNEEVKNMENLLTLKDYQRRLDTTGLKPSNELYTEYKSIDLTTRRMLYEGPLVWRVTKEKTIDVQCVLLGDLLVLFQKQDDKMLLKCQSKSNIIPNDGKQMLSPIIKLDSVFLREVATDRKALYVIFTWESGAQIYELVAHSVAERKHWSDVIKTAVEELKKSGGSTIDRKRLGSMPFTSSMALYSPSQLNPPLSPTENGGDSLKNSSDRDKDSLTDEKGTDPSPSLLDFLTTNGIDLPLDPSAAPPEKAAGSALDEVMSLKRLLVGSISLSEDSVGENGGAGPDGHSQETSECQSTEEDPHADGQTGGEGDVGSQREEEEGISAPLVLSQERLEEVRRRLQNLEGTLKKLQSVEEDHHRLQEAVAKYLQGGNYH
ncbi:rho guanine nucleotide exchange factor 1 [Chanos chanos]|uniref:Rho guanine nucleotide exchange factor 1 n=1 Tax=Chanos chanos TaxID=29144 RepID=A0A6J2W7D8_CHACN|nr:rho guanine nucleotide exchange factor 1 [Chanos chanos]